MTPESQNVPVCGLDSGVLFGEFVRRHNLAVESLTEQQLAEVIRQAIASGDIMRHVMHDGSAQAITYIPCREVSRLRDQYHELLYAVASKHDGETRHETALRYIREREERTEGPASSSPNTKVTQMHGEDSDSLGS